MQELQVEKFSWWFSSKLASKQDPWWWIKTRNDSTCTHLIALYVLDLPKFNARVLNFVFGPLCVRICMWPIPQGEKK